MNMELPKTKREVGSSVSYLLVKLMRDINGTAGGALITLIESLNESNYF